MAQQIGHSDPEVASDPNAAPDAVEGPVTDDNYQRLLHHIPAAIVVHGRDTAILATNGMAEELLGVSADQLLGRQAIDPEWHFLSEDGGVLPLAEYPVNQVLASRRPLRDFVAGVRRPGSTDAWVLVNAFPVTDPSGSVARVIVTFMDITARREAELALRESEARFRELYESAPNAYLTVGPDGIIRRCNLGAEALLGRAPTELNGRPILDLFADGTSGRLKASQILDRIHRGEGARNDELEMRKADGAPVWASLSVEVTSSPDKPALESRWGLTDITERKRAEEVLRISEGRYRMAQAVGHVGNWEYNLQTTHFWGSDEAKRIYGFDPESPEFSTEEVENCIPERQRVHQALVDLIEAGKPYDLEFAIQPRDGSPPRVISSVAELKRDERGAPLLVLGVIQDITRRKHAETTLVELNKDLEQRVAERTAELSSANQELEHFAYAVSHDLRAPLRHIAGYVDLIRIRIGAGLDQQSAHFMAVVGDSVRRMNQLIDDLLSFSRTLRQDITRTHVDLTAVLHDVVRELEPETRDRRVEWRLGPLPAVSGDAAMLRLVFVNLLLNALKFTRPREHPVIEVRCASGSAHEHLIFVRDNGVGFDPAHANKLFGVFQRLHRAEEFEGTGVGLANVRRIISRHGGRTWAESEVGRGATFYFSLPRME
jgi:PAS domain S-box-containing protein